MFKSPMKAILELANSDRTQQQFCDEFLQRLANYVEADAGIVWEATSNNFRVVSQFSIEDKPAKLNISRKDHERLLADAAKGEAPVCVRPADDASVSDETPMLLLGNFDRGGRHLIELMINETEEAKIEEMKQRFGVALASFPKSDSSSNAKALGMAVDKPQPGTVATGLAGNRITQDDLSGYLSAIHHSIDTKLTCANVANETRRLFDCDRVSVLLKKRGKFQMMAVSGQPSVNRRSNTTRLLEKVASRLIKTGQAFWYPDQTEIPTPVSQPLEEYLAISATRSLVVVPIYEKVEALVEDPESLERKTNRVIGGLVFEHCHERWERTQVERTIELASVHGGNAIRNAHRHQQLFLYPVWDLLGKSKFLTAPRLLPKTLMAVAAMILLTLFMVFYQVDFYVSADGVLVPKTLKPVFATADGEVQRLLVEHGQQVHDGDTLAIIKSPNHDLRLIELEGQLRTAKQRLESLENRQFEEVSKEEDNESMEDNIVSLREQIKNFERQQAMLRDISKRMIIKSPIDGQIITWDVKRNLQDRPVYRGEELFEVADTAGEWELEIDVPVRRTGHLQRAIDASDESLDVSFLLAADTTQRFQGKLVQLDQNASVNDAKEQIVKAKAAIEVDRISIDQTRTSVTAKIYCGRTSIGYLWLHDAQEFFYKNVVFLFE